MQRRQKVGGILDRRFGENDPTMTPEEKALERFVKEKQRNGARKASLFDLEDEGDEQEELTHFGRALSLTASGQVDDFDEAGLDGSDDEVLDAEAERRSRKRRRLSEDEADSGSSAEVEDENGNRAAPERFKTKAEVMKEVIAKSKLHKYERQKAKEDDDDLRAELDQGLLDIYALLQGKKRPSRTEEAEASKPTDTSINPDRAALLAGKDRSQADKEYDERLRQMAFDARAKPTERTKPEEERLKEEAEKLKVLEEKRLARMRGEGSGSDAESDNFAARLQGDEDFEDNGSDEDQQFLTKSIRAETDRLELGIEDEDEFVLDDDLIASGSEPNISEEEEVSASEDYDSEDDEEFIGGLLTKDDLGRVGLDISQASKAAPISKTAASILAFTYTCPQTHVEFLQITKSIAIEDLPTVVQRIRALYHPKLQVGNKTKTAGFASVLVDHISYLANQPRRPPFSVLEQLIRHVHSLAKSFPIEVSTAFRTHLKSMHESRPSAPTAGDLVLLTAISSTFPTSDHFHQVVTPAMLSMTRYLSQKIPKTIGDLAKGAFICTLGLQYQRLSKRYIPEVVNYILNGLCALAPSKESASLGLFPLHDLPPALRITSAKAEIRKLVFWDVEHQDGIDAGRDEELKLSLIKTFLELTNTMAELWSGLSAFYEIFEPFDKVLTFLRKKDFSKKLGSQLLEILQQAHDKVQTLRDSALHIRKPLALHNHRPQAIKTSIPKFEESYNPRKHYDPDRDRTELKKLKAEHKRERKGALRELRKDASFIARENLREKKEKDAAYEKKYKRLIAEIQGEEGREGNAYEREKRKRKGRK